MGRHSLSDGTQMVIRPITPEDKAELSAALARLSDETVHKRFLSPKRRFSAAELRYLTEVDGHHHVAFVAERADMPGRIIAVGRFVCLHDDPETAEFAIVVGDPYQGRGLGSLLADQLLAEAIAQGVKRFTATMLSDNVAAHRLLARLSGHLARRRTGSGAEDVFVDLPSPVAA